MRVVPRAQLVLLLLVVLLSIVACAPEEQPRSAALLPDEIARLTVDALRAAADVKVSGDIDAVLRQHTQSARYETAMRKHFAMMRELHLVGQRSQLRYRDPSVEVRHEQFCEQNGVAHLVAIATVRYDMESIPPASGAPPYTAGEEQHVFRFQRVGDGTWMMASHHEISLAEMHQRDVVARLRNPCGSAPVKAPRRAPS